MVRRAPQRGYSLVEMIIALSVFTVVFAILLGLTKEIRGHERRYPVNMMTHPQTNAVLTRLRRDVLDAYGSNPYADWNGYSSDGERMLVIESLQPNGGVQHIVWDFGTPGTARRLAFNVGNVASDWRAHGIPELKITTVDADTRHAYGVQITAADEGGRLAIDQIYQPRTHE